MADVIKKYEELGEPKHYEGVLGVEGATEVSSSSMGRASYGVIEKFHVRTYNLNNVTIVVEQEYVTHATNPRKREAVKEGWGSREFSFGGQESAIKKILTKIKKSGVKLEEII